MNPHYHHPYGGGGGGGGGNHHTEVSSPPPHQQPPSPPDNNNYHHHGGHHPGHMGGHHSSNGHAMGPLGHPGGPHDPHHHPLLGGGGHPHLSQHPAFGGGGGPPPGGPHHLHHPHHPLNNNNNNNGGGGGPGGGGTIKVCQGCGGKILERYLLHALDRYWHNGCLKCNCCGAMLADIGSSCFTKGGMILCKQDYMRLYGNSGACSACGQTIPASEFVMRSGGPTTPQLPVTAASAPPPPPPPQQPPQQHVFHLKCFACSKCGSPLVSGDRYYMVAANLVCEQDWHKMLKSTAAPAVRKGKVGRPRRSRD